jgi:hypothetical protein
MDEAAHDEGVLILRKPFSREELLTRVGSAVRGGAPPCA